MPGAVNPIRTGGNQIIFNTGVINSIGGNTAGALANISTGTFLLAGGDNVTLSQNGNSVTVSAGVGLTSQSGQALSGSNGSFAFQTASFGNLNGISFYTSNGSMVASHNGLTAQNLQAVSLSGNTSGVMASISSGTMILAGGNNITLSQNGNSVTISAGAGGGGGSISGGTTRGTLGEVVFSNSNGVSFGMNGQTMTGSHNGLTSQSNQALSAGNGSFAFQTANFADSNGVSFSTGTQGIFATVRTDYLSSQTNQTIGAYAASNTTQASSGTIDARSLSFQGAGVASVGISNGSVVISVPSGGGGGLSAGMSTDGKTAGTTGTVTGQMVFVGSNGIALSQSVNGASATLSLALATLSPYEWPFALMTNGGVWANGMGFIQPMSAIANVTATKIRFFNSVTLQTSTNNTMQGTLSASVGIYSLNGSTFSLASSGSQTFAWSMTSNGSTTLYNGVKALTMPMDVNMTPGVWYVAQHFRTSNGGTSQGSMAMSVMGHSLASLATNWGLSNAGTAANILGFGIMHGSNSFSTAMPSTFNSSTVRAPSAPRYFNIGFLTS